MAYNADDAPDLSGVADMTDMFRKASSFDGDLSSWDVSQATDMSGMFTSATAFDGDVSPWDVSSVTDMSVMFTLASSFNGNLSSWNVSSATGMGHMFLAANSFQQNLGNWYVVPEDTAYAIPEGTLNVTTISAQNPVLDGHSPEYGIGSGDGPALFNMAGSTLMFEAAPSVGRHPVNVTASGSGVFEGENSWRMLEIAVAGTDTDTTPPDITLHGANPYTIQAGTAYRDPGYSCTDDTDGTLTPVVTGTVDTDRPGTYTIIYTCTDSSDNISIATRTVTVIAMDADPPEDTTPPTITINGDNPLTITVGSTYTDDGATCTDETDGTLTPVATGTVDTDRPGTYTITYACTDGSGNAAYDSRTVLVRAAEAADDADPPRIDITGESRVRLHVGDAYAEQGAECIDDVEGTWAARVHKSTVDTSSAGSYIVIYECADSSGNASLKIRHVEVAAPEKDLPPVITLNGPSTVTVAVGSAFDDPGATCTDPEGGSLEVTVRGGNPDTSSAGKRHIHYSCTDSDGKTDSVVRTVMVQ